MTNNKGKVSVENTKATSNNKSNGNFGKHGWIFIIYGMFKFFITTAVSDSINNLSLPAFCEKYGWNYANLLSLRGLRLFLWSSLGIYYIGDQPKEAL